MRTPHGKFDLILLRPDGQIALSYFSSPSYFLQGYLPVIGRALPGLYPGSAREVPGKSPRLNKDGKEMKTGSYKEVTIKIAS